MSSGTLRVACFLAALVFGLSLYANASLWLGDAFPRQWIPPFRADLDLNRNHHLGAEYHRIALALVDGRGFSDPFGANTGPTAWMPPVYPLLLACLLWLFGSSSSVVVAVLLLKNCALVVAGIAVFELASRTRRRLNPLWSVVAYCAWLLTYFHWFFQLTHDVWLVLLLMTAILGLAYWIAFARSHEKGERAAWRWGWGALGGLGALTSPIAGFAWIGASGFLLCRRPSLARPLAVAVLLAGLCASTWVVRNAVTFDRLVLTKSNLFFDLYLANYVSPDGVYDEGVFVGYHPMWTRLRTPDFMYAKLGEVEYLERFRRQFQQAFEQAPGVYFEKVGRRAMAATVLLKPYRAYVEGEHPPLRSIVHSLPFLGLILAWLLAGDRKAQATGPLGLATVLYVFFLAPYVAAAFYGRYLLPLTPVLVLFVFWGADALFAARRRGETKSSATNPGLG